MGLRREVRALRAAVRAARVVGQGGQAPEGPEVRAAAAGQVVHADWLRGYGNLMVLDHGDGLLSVYGNNESLLREAGQAVKAGEVVATVGNTGGNPESGLYFELRHQGQAFDPLRWVSPR